MPKRSHQAAMESDSFASRGGSYVSRACDECRKRKMKCDGVRPMCGVCTTKGSTCEYNDEDKRKTNAEQMDDMRNRVISVEASLNERMGRIEALLTTLASNSGIPSANTQSQISPQDVSVPMNPGQTSTAGDGQTSAADAPTYDRLHRIEESEGALVQIGPTSLWSYKRSAPSPQAAMNGLHSEMMIPGDYEDWSRNLPSTLNIDRQAHDRAMAFFSAYYAPWCLVIDVTKFLRDMSRCTLVRPTDRSFKPPTRTSHYSPLLHCCALYMGVFINRREWPLLMRSFDAAFMAHCTGLLMAECDQAVLSSIRAYNLFAQCIHNHRLQTLEVKSGERQNATGYIFSGLAISSIHSLGLNVNSEHHVRRGDITQTDRQARDYTYWTIYLQDAFRAFASGRPPMLAGPCSIDFPAVDPTIDDVPWFPPLPAANDATTQAFYPACAGQRGLHSTVLHWTSRLVQIGREAIEVIYSSHRPDDPGQQRQLAQISDKLIAWYSEMPLQPAEMFPLPHVIQLHLAYHLLLIYVHRPFYRSKSVLSVERCNQAAQDILHLAKSFQSHHGLRLSHHNSITVIFCAATIFLMQCANASHDNASRWKHFEDFKLCTEYLGEASATWHEAGTSREILLSLQTEFIPVPPPPAETVNNLNMETAFPFANGMLSTTDLEQWLSDQTLWNIGTPEQDPLQSLFPM